MRLGKSKVSSGRSAARVNARASSLPARWLDRPLRPRSPGWVSSVHPGSYGSLLFTLVQAMGPKSTSQMRTLTCVCIHYTPGRALP